MSSTQRTLHLYWQHSKAYPALLWGILGLMPVLQLADDFITPLLTSKILNRLAHSTGPIQLNEFTPLLAGILAIELVINLVWRPYVRMVWTFEENVMKDLYTSSFRHLMKMSYRFYSNRFAGSIVSQVSKFSSAYERLADTLLWGFYKLVIAFVLTVILLIKPAPLYVAVLTFFTTIYMAILLKVKKSERPLNKAWAQAESDRTGQLADSISNIMAVKSFAHEDLELDLFTEKVNAVHARSMDTMRKVMRNERYTTTAQRAINAAAILSAIYLAAHSKIAIGTVYLALIYTLSIIRRLWDMNNTLRNLNRVFGDAHDMTEMLQVVPEVKNPRAPVPFSPVRGDIVFDHVTFAYPEQPDQPLFKDFSLHIKPGEKIGLVGHSGSGKTTLTKLLLRFMDIDKGRILIDSQDIASVTQDALRKNITYVPQEPLMFHRSIADNIRYGQLDADEESVLAAARMANAHEFIETLPHGYETLVGERGTKLSGGQRQRIAIARALLKNAPILLLDEATSALDSESEQLIQEALWKLMEGRTAIVIAHRLSTIQKMDRIIVVEHGNIVEQGSHTELLRQNNVYAKLWSRQSGGFIDE